MKNLSTGWLSKYIAKSEVKTLLTQKQFFNFKMSEQSIYVCTCSCIELKQIFHVHYQYKKLYVFSCNLEKTHTHTPCMFPRNCTRNHILLLVPVSPVTRHNFRGHIYVSIAVLLRRQTLYNCNEVEYSRLLDTIFIYCVFEVGCSYLMVQCTPKFTFC